ncbi:MAG: DNA-deoxyinosine glycosylase [Clostridia bacterium]|nr:DNA-deoxyinosine glycosylase [Clostridia bacterium]
MAERIYGFEPVWRSDARMLILGSMPSVESLHQSFYYAHPRNAFWPMLAEILNEPLPLSIEEKKAMLLRHRIALWDTVGSCERAGSLDSAIRDPQPNDFEALFRNCPNIKHIFFNGGTAHQLYLRLVAREDVRRSYHRMPSTSPAYTLKYEIKKARWQAALKEAFPDEPL